MSLFSDYIRVFNPPNGGHILQGKYKTKVINCTECLPTCHESKYNVDYDPIPNNDWRAQMGGDIHLDVFYKDLGAIKYRRERAFTLMNLVGKKNNLPKK